MIVIDPVNFGDTGFQRASTATYFDRDGIMRIAPVNAVRVCYDPSDLSKAPYALIEAAATNLLPQLQYWSAVGVSVSASAVNAPDGTNTASLVTVTAGAGVSLAKAVAATANAPGAYSIYFCRGNVDVTTTQSFGIYNQTTGRDLVYADVNFATGQVIALRGLEAATSTARTVDCGAGWWRLELVIGSGFSVGDSLNICAGALNSAGTVGHSFNLWGPQFEQAAAASSYIPTTNAAASRAADVVGSGAGVLYSNVPITEPDYSATATYAKGVLVHDPATHLTYESLIDGNVGNPLSTAGKWLKRDVTNRWKMLDKYNNTQTSNADEIVLVLTPVQLAQGVYLGNMDANEVRISVTDVAEGVVFRYTKSLVVANTGASFYRWFFSKIVRSDYAILTSLPPYSNAFLTICIRKLGSIAKCGMSVAGPTDFFGPNLWGMSLETKDYSNTVFNIDGTSETVLRPFSKKVSVDVSIKNENVDYVHGRLAAYRQRFVVWVCGPLGSTVVGGRFSSFKTVIEGKIFSKMAMTIEGAV